ncbi:lipid-A-disaccharide synthase [uncultured Leptotrichia sp.]|uniref:lipid-A-disaccharide synthase n=1 Tax=uncultured Leptotrichia sp. TaxID=159271 RepID=UPI002612561A|nr:lipid-A-disaccharide synthase [uncultured Leptotrichia sp.]
MSGDLHASYIVEEMRKKDKNVEFFGVVGDKSIKAGVKPVNHIKNNDVMGFVEALKKYSYFTEKAHEYLEFIKENGIETVIFVDFGGFNLKFFELLKKKILEKELQNLRMVYYIPPKVWAWGKKRIEKLKKFDDVIVIFPFEKAYYDNTLKKNELKGLKVEYFGNPFVDKYEFSDKLGEKILLLPGSRRQEIEKFLPVIMELVRNEKVKNEKFLMKLASRDHIKYIHDFEKKYKIDVHKILNLEITFDEIKNIRKDCKYAIATSGTVTFEISLMGLPVIVVYKTSKINAFIARKIVKIKYITLTNLNANKEIFKELLQEDFSVEKLLEEMEIMEKNKENVVLELKKEREKLGNFGVLEKIADYLLENRD